MTAPPEGGKRPSNLTASVIIFAALAAVSFVLGFIGFWQYFKNPEVGIEPSLDKIVYHDLQLFVLGADPLQGDPDNLPVTLQIARFAAPAVAIFAVIEGARVLFFTEYHRRRARRSRGHVVVCGDSTVARTLVDQLRAKGRTVVMVAGRRVGADQRRRMTVIGDPGDPDTLRAAGVPRADTVYVATSDTAINISVAVRVSQLAERRTKPLSVYAHVRDPELCVSLQARRLAQPQPPGVRLDFFNIDDLAARVLFRTDPLPAHADRPTRILIAGGTSLSEAVLVQAARHWRVRENRATAAKIVVDYVAPDAANTTGALRKRYPFLEDTCDIKPYPIDLRPLLAGGSLNTPHDRTFLCYPDETDGLRVALTAHRLWQGRHGSVFVPLYDLTELTVAFQNERSHPLLDQVQGRLQLFPMIKNACNPELIEQDLVERLARLIHENYLVDSSKPDGDGHPSTEVVWEKLTEDRRRDNLDQAQHIGTKLQKIDCVVVPRVDGGPLFRMTETEVERLAKMEQERWKKGRELAGWRYGPTRDDGQRVSPYLLDWEDMPEKTRRKNRDAIRDLPAILADGGFEIVRLPRSSAGRPTG